MAKQKSAKSKPDVHTDYLGLLSHFVADYFNQKYKIKKKVEDIKKGFIQSLFNLKKEFMKTIVETLFLVTGLLALIVGIIMLLNNYFPLEYIFVVYGLIMTIFILLKTRLSV